MKVRPAYDHHETHGSAFAYYYVGQRMYVTNLSIDTTNFYIDTHTPPCYVEFCASTDANEDAALRKCWDKLRCLANHGVTCIARVDDNGETDYTETMEPVGYFCQSMEDTNDTYQWLLDSAETQLVDIAKKNDASWLLTKKGQRCHTLLQTIRRYQRKANSGRAKRPEKKLVFTDLTIEVTRRCNMACEHCLRDDNPSPDKYLDISEKTLDKLLSQTRRIGHVTFSGGEPSLALDRIRLFYQLCEKHNVDVGSFYLVTNGKENQTELALLMMERYTAANIYEREMCGVSISIDQFHEAFLDHGPDEIIKTLTFYNHEKEHSDLNDLKWVRNSGRAEKLLSSSVENPTAPCITTEFSVGLDENEATIEFAYLSVNGNLYPECDLSYQRMDECKADGADAAIQNLPVSNELAYDFAELLGDDNTWADTGELAKKTIWTQLDETGQAEVTVKLKLAKQPDDTANVTTEINLNDSQEVGCKDVPIKDLSGKTDKDIIATLACGCLENFDESES